MDAAKLLTLLTEARPPAKGCAHSLTLADEGEAGLLVCTLVLPSDKHITPVRPPYFQGFLLTKPDVYERNAVDVAKDILDALKSVD